MRLNGWQRIGIVASVIWVPTTGMADCCACAASGHAAAAPPSSVMKSRRLTSSMGSSPEPAVPAYRKLRMPRKHPQVLGLDLNRSEQAGTRSGRRSGCGGRIARTLRKSGPPCSSKGKKD